MKVYVPAGVEELVEIVSVEAALEPGTKLTVAGFSEAVRPLADWTAEVEMTMLPVNPRLSIVICESADPPAMKLEGLGVETVALKSPVTVIVKVTE